MAYQPGVPTGSVPLNQDYLNLQGNFSSLNNQWLVDHVPLTTAPGPSIGYHTFVHLVPFSTTVTNAPNNQPVVAPAATPGFGQLFGAQINDGLNTDQALYYLSGGGRLTQLTRNIQPLAAASGYTFLPGGFLMQWGIANVTTPNPLTITYLQPLKSAAFSIQLTQINPNNANVRVFGEVLTGTSLTTGFDLYAIGANGGTQNGQFYWLSIGL